jgi:hypothetical protein
MQTPFFFLLVVGFVVVAVYLGRRWWARRREPFEEVDTFGYSLDAYDTFPNPPTPSNVAVFSGLQYVDVFQYFTLRGPHTYCVSNNDPAFLRQFVATELSGITRPFKLILAHGDHGASNLWTPLSAVLAHPHLIYVYMVNCDRTHPKLRGIPIGLDLHTAFFRMRANPQTQEETLRRVRQSLPQPKDRPATAYSTAHLNPSDRAPMHELKGGRQEIRKRFARSTFVYLEPEPLNRLDSWQRHGEHLFILSPAGNGLDCHRTWEALALGNIPILQHSPIDALYADLPVVFVDSWADITSQRLVEWKSELLHPSRVYNWDKLLWSYWKRFITEEETKG